MGPNSAPRWVPFTCRFPDKRILLNDHQRIRLAAKAKRLTRELLEATTVLFTPDTILGWHRKLIAQKYDGSENCKNPGRPKVSQEITDLVIRFKKENPHWGYTRIRDYIVHLGYKIGETTVKNILLENGFDPEPDLTRKTTWKKFIKSHWSVLAACDFFSVELLVRGKLVRCMVLFAIDVATRRVEILGLHAQPNGPWMEQIARNVSGEGDFLAGKKYLIHDRDPLYTAKFESILKAAGVRYNRKLWMACMKKAAYPSELEHSMKTHRKGHATWQTVAYRATLCQSVPGMC